MQGHDRQRRRVVVLLLACLLVPASFSAQAGHAHKSWRGERVLVEQPAARSKQQAAKQAVRRHGGQVLRVEYRGNHYRVRLLMQNGRVRHVDIPAAESRS